MTGIRVKVISPTEKQTAKPSQKAFRRNFFADFPTPVYSRFAAQAFYAPALFRRWRTSFFPPVRTRMELSTARSITPTSPNTASQSGRHPAAPKARNTVFMAMENAMFCATIVFFAVYAVLMPLLGNAGLWIAFLAYLLMRGVVQLALSKRRILG